MRVFFLITLIVLTAVTAVAQQVSSQSRAQEIAAAFTKYKSLTKEKYGFTKTKYKDVRSEPMLKQNAGDYAGVYEVSDLGDTLAIQVDNDGRIQANGSETVGGQSRTFRIADAKIAGALITGNKVYDNGTTEKFEGAFLKKTERNSPTESGTTTFGLGVLLGSPREYGGNTYDKLFYQRK